MTDDQGQAKFWCFTENSNAREFWGRLGDIYETNQTHISYVCGQLEEGSHLHFQGYIQLKRGQRKSWLINNVSATASYEKQRGTCDQARDYCKKVDETVLPDTFIEFGTYKPGKSGRGARNDIHVLRDAIKQGKTQRQIVEDDQLVETFANYIKFHDRVRMLYEPPPRENGVLVKLYVGEPGTGKTRRAKEEYPGIFEIPISNGTLWLDGYDDHEHVLIDDFMGKGSKMGLDNTLKFLDRYVRKVPVKGTYAWYRPEVIVVTSNYHPRHWYDWKGREESWRALKRRFHEIWYFPADSPPEEQYNDEYLENREFWPEPNVEYFQ